MASFVLSCRATQTGMDHFQFDSKSAQGMFPYEILRCPGLIRMKGNTRILSHLSKGIESHCIFTVRFHAVAHIKLLHILIAVQQCGKGTDQNCRDQDGSQSEHQDIHRIPEHDLEIVFDEISDHFYTLSFFFMSF